MATNILDRYGIKEVADVTFYELSKAGVPTKPVLFLDTLKVSTIEQTAESADAKGGKGNTALISWDYGKEINVTLEDALFSAKSMAIMFGNGSVKNYNGSEAYIMKTEQFVPSATTLPTEGVAVSGWNPKYEGPDGKLYVKKNPKFYSASGVVLSALVADEKCFCTFDIAVDGAVIEVGASTFPGTYYVTGDTYARSEQSGDDEFFQFIIPKAKVQSENTITLEAEGDPSTFNMSLKVLRPTDGVMMRLVKYDAINGQDAAAESTSATLVHNHVLNAENASLSDLAITMAHDVSEAKTVYVINSQGGTLTASVTGDITATPDATARTIAIVPTEAATAGSATATVSEGGTQIGVVTVTLS